MGNLAIITARGGSKRIPKKNIKEFCGKPIIAYTIEAALKSGMFEEVMVSTDSEEIAEIAKQYGARVPFMRSEEAANDFAPTAKVVEEVVLSYEKEGRNFEKLCCIYPTAPFLTAERLKEAMQKLIDTNAFSVIPVVRYSFPPQRGLEIKDGVLRYIHPEHTFTRSQDLEPVYHDAGQFYCLDTVEFLKKLNLFGDTTKEIILDEMEVQDIDTLTDWKLAELKYRLLHEEE
ncbi:MAG: pseudaminic acid cytidylyltransferase [Lachnospiraceae bacterium]|nr:pseudaminic acid cytidylyltransferase [Lachnospiraceae bacterium]